ncbi:MAG: UDP-N-acetylenolpyruvoylglucosamine reductase [Bdellovibrio sp. CG10_big_fil_rev_8_21_14_0_10_47_8]|nr:MAG: UDP-N-acetylenolpyruvoylglucosamine reductase [Bdellovibrio sp. CG10_big_fil_rev_8_21_14_0_10_47_8]
MISIQEDVLLAPYTSWLVGGPAQFFVLPENIEDLREALKWATDSRQEVTLLGGGSNVLVSDKGLQGLVICLKKMTGTEVKTDEGALRITALSGTSKSELLKIFLKHQLAPALFLAGLPGDVGGGIVMNAGVAESFSPREFVEITEWVEVMRPDGHIDRFLCQDLRWSYRHTQGWEPGVIVRVGLVWPLIPDPSILDQVKTANKVRLSKQPLDQPSCGSVFVNPEGHKAAQLIDSCGLKGFQIGDAQVSMKHANFIVNRGTAKSSDIWQVIQHVQKTVREKRGIELKTEVVRLPREESL